MEPLVRIAWGLLAAVHMMPALVFFSPALTERLYGVAPDGDVGLLIVHRGALFLAILVASLFAIFDPAVRRAAFVIVAISVVGFLVAYMRAGMPAGALRSIAIADLIALAPLALVGWAAWRN